ncbi:MAG: hypothetical protein KC486_18120 [Myxococcales bacterium]|nr:hypothetical protein [Myxococcales bacterium]
MLRPAPLLLVTSLCGLALASCFTGDAALNLPCESKADCGLDHACVQGYCVAPGTEPCGNGVINSNEECDDGEQNGAGSCTPMCTLPTCGDAFVSDGEACDDGPDGSKTCTPACAANVCGDGHVGADEECDNGESNGVEGPCSADCTVNACGDGFMADDEECDDGQANAAEAMCTPVCTVNVCGDGYEAASEGCDSDDRDVCTEACEFVFFSDDVDAGIGGWTHNLDQQPAPNQFCDPPDVTIHCAADQWIRTSVSNLANHPDGGDSTFAWYSGDLSDVQGPMTARLVSPEIDLTGAAAPITLSFFHLYDFKDIGEPNSYGDGAIVEVSVDGGPWEQLALPGYTATINDPGNCLELTAPENPLLGLDAFVGTTNTWLGESGSLDAYAGAKIRLGFTISSDCAAYATTFDQPVEWYVDNVTIVGGRQK